jgi:hypothetical protein
VIRAAARALGAALLLGLAVLAWWLRPGDLDAELRAAWSPLERLVREPRPDLGRGVERWWMISSRGDTVGALWRPGGRGSRWTAVLLGGIGTGDRAALLVPEGLPVSVLAVDWPWRGPRRMPAWDVVLRIPAIRSAALASPAALALGLEAVSRAAGVDTARVALLGVSLGAPPAVAALRLSRVPDALAIVDGAGDLAPPFERAFLREGVAPAAAGALAALSARLLRPLEPWRHRSAAAGIPALVVSSRGEELLPRASVERLHATLPHAEVRWHDGPHIRPQQRERIAAIAGDVLGWLERLPPSPAR